MAADDSLADDWISEFLSGDLSDEFASTISAPTDLGTPPEGLDSYSFQNVNDAGFLSLEPLEFNNQSEGHLSFAQGESFIPSGKFSNVGFAGDSNNFDYSAVETGASHFLQDESHIPSHSIGQESHVNSGSENSNCESAQNRLQFENFKENKAEGLGLTAKLENGSGHNRIDCSPEADAHSDGSEAGHEDSESAKRQARLMRNRESAQLSRQRKKVYVDELENKLRTMQATVTELSATISHLTAENVNLRGQLAACGAQAGSGKAGSLPAASAMFPFGMFGMHPGGMPGYVPAIPIPRLKSAKAASASKPAKKTKPQNESGKKRMKKAAGGAGVVALALFCLVSVFSPSQFSLSNPFNMWGTNSLAVSSGLQPWRKDTSSDFSVQGYRSGRVLMSVPESALSLNESGFKDLDGSLRTTDVRLSRKYDLKSGEVQKLKSMAVVSMEKQKVGVMRALPGTKLPEKITKARPADDVPLLLGDSNGYHPLLAHGFCSEVFQFESSVSQQPGNDYSAGIENSTVPANSSAKSSPAAQKGVHRRLGGFYGSGALPLPPVGQKNRSNDTYFKPSSSNASQPLMTSSEEPAYGSSDKEKAGKASSVVVSLFTSPSGVGGLLQDEARSEEGQLSSVFVVVLLNGVKYVTYSCKLPSAIVPGKLVAP